MRAFFFKCWVVYSIGGLGNCGPISFQEGGGAEGGVCDVCRVSYMFNFLFPIIGVWC